MAVLDLLFLVFINLVWGLNFIALKWAVADFPPLVSNAIRFLIVAIVLAPFLRHTVGRFREVLGVAFLLGVLHFGIVIMAMKLSQGVTSVAIVSQLSIPFATIFAILMLKEHVGWKRVAGIAFSFAGVLIIGFDPVIFSQGTALVMMAVGAAFIALSTIYMRPYCLHYILVYTSVYHRVPCRRSIRSRGHDSKHGQPNNNQPTNGHSFRQP